MRGGFVNQNAVASARPGEVVRRNGEPDEGGFDLHDGVGRRMAVDASEINQRAARDVHFVEKRQVARVRIDEIERIELRPGGRDQFLDGGRIDSVDDEHCVDRACDKALDRILIGEFEQVVLARNSFVNCSFSSIEASRPLNKREMTRSGGQEAHSDTGLQM